MAVTSLLLVIVMHLLNLLPVKIIYKKRENNVQQKSEREEESGEKEDLVAAERSTNSQRRPGVLNFRQVSALDTKQLRWIPRNIISVSFVHSVNCWILKWFLLKLPLFAAISYSRLSTWQLPETLIVESNLPLHPSKIVCKWDEIFHFFWHLWRDYTAEYSARAWWAT